MALREKEKNKGLNYCSQNEISYVKIQYTQIPSQVEQHLA